MTEPANTPTEPTAPAEPTPAVTPADGGTPTPAAPEGTLLADQPTDGDPKPAETKTEEKQTETKPEGAPEKYDFKAPEGQEYDGNLLDSFSAAAKDANLSQDAAQKLLDTMAPALAARQAEQVETVQKQWREASTTDKEFGGEKLKENLGVAKKAYDQFASPELRTLLETTGLGNHPEVIRMLYRVGKAISEDAFVAGTKAPQSSKDAATVLYDNTPVKE